MKTGILVEDTNFGDLNYHVMKELNRCSGIYNVCLFTLDISSMVLKPDFAVMSMSKLGYFNNGLLVATSLETARILNKSYGNNKKILFLHSLEWLYKSFSFDYVYDVLHSIQLVVRSQDQKEFLERVFKLKDIYVIEEFNLEKIYGIC